MTVCLCLPLCLYVQACVCYTDIYYYGQRFARVHIYIRECVRFHATGLCGLVLLAIDRAAQLRLLMG